MNIVKQTTYTIIDDDDNEFVVGIEPDKDSVQIMKVTDDRYLIGYLARDTDPINPFEYQDGLGEIYTCSRWDGTFSQYEAACLNPHHVMLSVYDHSGRVYSLLGHGVRCMWDTIDGGAVWEPDKSLSEALGQTLAEEGQEAYEKQKRTFSRQACDIANALELGDVWGMVIQEDSDHHTAEMVWEIFGYDHAMKELKSEMESKREWLLKKQKK